MKQIYCQCAAYMSSLSFHSCMFPVRSQTKPSCTHLTRRNQLNQSFINIYRLQSVCTQSSSSTKITNLVEIRVVTLDVKEKPEESADGQRCVS